VRPANSSSISTEGCRGRGAGFVAGFAGSFWVGASFVLCSFASNLFLFRSTSGSPLVVTFVESLRLHGPEASGESVGIGWECGMWFRQMWIFFGNAIFFFYQRRRYCTVGRCAVCNVAQCSLGRLNTL
jgi:hypothetical protein